METIDETDSLTLALERAQKALKAKKDIETLEATIAKKRADILKAAGFETEEVYAEAIATLEALAGKKPVVRKASEKPRKARITITPAIIDEMKKRQAAGESPTKISEDMKISYQTVLKHLKAK